MRVGLFGGTFNPIHYGHLRAAEEVREKAAMDKIVFIPAGVPPFKSQEAASAKARLEMTGCAIADNAFFELSDIECRTPRTSFTLDTISELIRLEPHNSFFFILGVDAFLELPLWHKPDQLVSLVSFILISRPGFHFSDLSESPYLITSRKQMRELEKSQPGPIEISLTGGGSALIVAVTPIGASSTGIRDDIRDGRSVRYLLPPEVQSYIINNGLYRK
jgi:nicotinate-nucleotide adenylyltransferase